MDIQENNLSITIENKFELNQAVYAKQENNSIVRGEIQWISTMLSNDSKFPKLNYGIELKNGKNIRTVAFSCSNVFATADDAFGIPLIDL
jgi:hypothetical protein